MSAKKRRGPYVKRSVSSETEIVRESLYNVDPNVKDISSPKKARVSVPENESQPTNMFDPSVSSSDESCHIEEWLPVYHQPEVKDSDLDILFETLKAEISKDENEFADETPLSVFCDHINETLYVDSLVEEPELVIPKTTKIDNSENPLYSGSKRLLGVTMLLLCCFMVRYQISDEAMSALLSLLELLLPSDSKLTNSLYGLKKYLERFVSLPQIRHYCTSCYTHVDSVSTKCTNELCSQDLTLTGSKAYFVQHSLISQLRIMFLRKAFTDKIRRHRFNHYSQNERNVLRDVYDGANYKKLFNADILSDANNLSFSMNTDGVPIFKSSGVSMWPVYLLINELPIKERKARENILFFGIWISAGKPMMWSFLQPLHDELITLGNGVKFTDHSKKTFTSKAYLISSICDLPAKCLLTNSMQFNGAHSCWYCLQKGETYTTDKGGRVHVFPFMEKDPVGPARTTHNLKSDIAVAVNTLKINNYKKIQPIRGIKGPNWFMNLPNFNIIHGFVIDYMHGICLGVMKLLLTLWFDKDHKQEIYSCYKLSKQIDADLKGIKPNLDITRIPRGVSELIHWKASEFRNFLLYWGLPVMCNVLPNEHYIHFCLLVKSMHILLSDHITEEEMGVANNCLLQFVSHFANYYSLRFVTMNLHQLLHLVENVRANGPLYCNNLFVFEDLNGFIKKNIHGTQAVDKQVIKTVSIIQAIPVLKEKFLIADSDENTFLLSLSDSSFQNWKTIDETFSVIGKIIDADLTDAEYNILHSMYSRILNVKQFNRIFLKSRNCLLFSSSYTRMYRRDQSIIKYADNGNIRFGSIKLFLTFENSNGSSFAGALINCLPGTCDYKPQDRIHKVFANAQLTNFVPFKDIISLCMLVRVKSGNRLYICEFPNRSDSN